MSFVTEREMSTHFRASFASLVEESGIAWMAELEGLFGKPDYVLFKTSSRGVIYVVSFELKLRDWRRGLRQAFRYRTFSNEVFLVVDSARLRPALENLDAFQRANVGLASYGVDGVLRIHQAPTPGVPFSSEFSYRAVCRIANRLRETITVDPSVPPRPTFSRTTLGRFVVQSASAENGVLDEIE